jgi:methyl-accepting chemotaxis protein
MTVERWTDVMLDELASSVSEMRDSITEMRDSITEVRDSVDGLRVTSQALLQVAAQNQRDMELMKQRQLENDQRFNILLEEVRHLGRRIEEK